MEQICLFKKKPLAGYSLSRDQLAEWQSLDLDTKIEMTKERIKSWYESWDGAVHVSFSGGKDSTVLLHLVRSMYPDVVAVFVNTGLEYPEIVSFVKKHKNVKIVRPKTPFHKVIEKHGYPVLSKKISTGLDRYRRTKSQVQKNLRLHGGINPTSGKKQFPNIPKKWHHLVNAPFKASERCCEVMKKEPLSRVEKELGTKPLIAIMAADSDTRRVYYLKQGCNAFDSKKPKSMPMAFWTEEDVWEYIKRFNVPYCKIYDMGYDRTGCTFCMFGIEQESKKGLNRFQRMKQTHPKLWKYCMDRLGIRAVMEYLGFPVE